MCYIDNDAVPTGLYPEIASARLVLPSGSNPDAQTTRITDPQELKNLKFVVGQTENETIWEICTDLYSKQHPKSPVLYTKALILRIAREENIEEYPQFKDIKVRSSEIEHRKNYNTSVKNALPYIKSEENSRIQSYGSRRS